MIRFFISSEVGGNNRSVGRVGFPRGLTAKTARNAEVGVSTERTKILSDTTRHRRTRAKELFVENAMGAHEVS
jgi:hypothetical protein